jgi:hypothetical protein
MRERRLPEGRAATRRRRRVAARPQHSAAARAVGGSRVAARQRRLCAWLCSRARQRARGGPGAASMHPRPRLPPRTWLRPAEGVPAPPAQGGEAHASALLGRPAGAERAVDEPFAQRQNVSGKEGPPGAAVPFLGRYTEQKLGGAGVGRPTFTATWWVGCVPCCLPLLSHPRPRVRVAISFRLGLRTCIKEKGGSGALYIGADLFATPSAHGRRACEATVPGARLCEAWDLVVRPEHRGWAPQ